MAKTTGKRGTGGSNQIKNLEMMGLEAGRKPPQAVDIEEAVLGALLLEPNSIADVMDVLVPECFYKEANRKIFQAISALAMRHDAVDIYTVAQELRKTDDLELIGGPYYLTQLSMKIGAAAHLDYHTKILVQKYIQRELISISYEVQRDAFDDSLGVDDLLDNTQQKIFTLADRNMKRETQSVQDVINEAIADLESVQMREDGLSGVPSGYTGIDRVTLGWQASDLIILAARPSVGKTAFVLNLARNAAVDFNMPVAFFSLEMPAIQLAKRMMVSETRLSADKIKGGVKLQPWEWEQLDIQLKRLAKAPIYIDDTPSLPVMEFRSKVKKLVKQKGVRLIVVDYLQLMQGPSELRGMREQEVAAISRTLKATAKEMNVPIIALSQLSRQSENRVGSNRRPQLSDLRESGSIEQDADMVIFIHRYDYQGLNEDPNDVGKTQIIIAKHRNGAIADIDMRFRADEVRFVDDQESLVNTADSMPVSSAMNDDVPFAAPSAMPSNDFGANDEFM